MRPRSSTPSATDLSPSGRREPRLLRETRLSSVWNPEHARVRLRSRQTRQKFKVYLVGTTGLYVKPAKNHARKVLHPPEGGCIPSSPRRGTLLSTTK